MNQAEAMAELCSIIVESVRDVGTMGAPSGPMYAALMQYMTLEQYQTIMGGLVAAGKLRQVGHVYYAV
jgi:hypothetical protein